MRDDMEMNESSEKVLNFNGPQKHRRSLAEIFRSIPTFIKNWWNENVVNRNSYKSIEQANDEEELLNAQARLNELQAEFQEKIEAHASYDEIKEIQDEITQLNRQVGVLRERLHLDEDEELVDDEDYFDDDYEIDKINDDEPPFANLAKKKYNFDFSATTDFKDFDFFDLDDAEDEQKLKALLEEEKVLKAQLEKEKKVNKESETEPQTEEIQKEDFLEEEQIEEEWFNENLDTEDMPDVESKKDDTDNVTQEESISEEQKNIQEMLDEKRRQVQEQLVDTIKDINEQFTSEMTVPKDKKKADQSLIGIAQEHNIETIEAPQEMLKFDFDSIVKILKNVEPKMIDGVCCPIDKATGKMIADENIQTQIIVGLMWYKVNALFNRKGLDANYGALFNDVIQSVIQNYYIFNQVDIDMVMITDHLESKEYSEQDIKTIEEMLSVEEAQNILRQFVVRLIIKNQLGDYDRFSKEQNLSGVSFH